MKRLALFLAFTATGCNSGPKAVPVSVSYVGSSWEMGEVKSCTEGDFKDKSPPVLLCSPAGGAAFYMTLGAMSRAKDDKARADARDVFLKNAKILMVVFQPKPAEFAPIWDCLKRESGLDCKAP